MIVDNVQVAINNIHIRIEDKEETDIKEILPAKMVEKDSSLNRFSMGVTLDHIYVTSVDE